MNPVSECYLSGLKGRVCVLHSPCGYLKLSCLFFFSGFTLPEMISLKIKLSPICCSVPQPDKWWHITHAQQNQLQADTKEGGDQLPDTPPTKSPGQDATHLNLRKPSKPMESVLPALTPVSLWPGAAPTPLLPVPQLLKANQG